MNRILTVALTAIITGMGWVAQAAPVPALRAPGGVNDFGTVANSGTVQINGQLTMEAWLYPTGWRSYTGREKHGLNFIYKGRIGSHIDYMFSLQANGYLCFGNTRGTIGILRPVVPLNQWTHVAVSLNEGTGTIKFYVNGVDQGGYGTWGGGVDRFNPILPSANPLYIGGFNQLGWGYNNDNFIGKIADVRIWNVARTQADIQENFQKRLKGNEAGLAAYWNFDDRFDKSPNGNNMTLGGNASILSGEGPDLAGAGGIEVEITSPANNTVFSQGANVTVNATAINTNGVALVRFLRNGSQFGTDNAAPFSAVLSNVPAGIHTLTAFATNNNGEVGTSADVIIKVQGPFGGTPAAIPGLVEFEKYDLGGQDVAFNDTSSANEGGVYRTTESVDIAAAAGASNGHLVGWARANEWLEYTVAITTTATFTVDTRVACQGAGGTFRVEMNGADITGPLQVPDTGSWSTYQIVRKTGVELTEGVKTMRVVMISANASGFVGNFDAMMITTGGPNPPPPPPPPVQSAYPSSTPWPVPGAIEAENFDQGGSGVAYQDLTGANLGGAYRASEAVDIAVDPNASNGHVVGWATQGEWMEYTINVGVAGDYELAARVACQGSGGTFLVEVDGVDVTGAWPIPNTGSWSTYQVISTDGIALTEGVKTVRVFMVANGSGFVGNFDQLVFSTASEPPPPPPPPEQYAYPAGTPVVLPGRVEAENYDHGGSGVAYADLDAANLGNAYRTTESVDIAEDPNAANGHLVGWAKAGEWLEYTVNVLLAGDYDLEARVASHGPGGSFRVLIDGVDVTGPVDVPDTGAWGTFQILSESGIALVTGIKTVRVEMVSNGTRGFVGNIDWIDFSTDAVPPPPPDQYAYPAGTPWPVPGIIEAERYDQGGPGHAYNDLETANLGGGYRLTEAVDIATDANASNGLVVGWTKAGEWLEYTVDITGGIFNMAARVASHGIGGSFRVEVNGSVVAGPIPVPDTGAWNTYQDLMATAIPMASGISTIRVVMVSNGIRGFTGNFDQFRFTPVPVSAPSVRSEALVGGRTLPVDVQSSNMDTADAWSVVDGNPKTIWQADPVAGGWWLTLVYDPDRTVSDVAIDWAYGSPTNHLILVSRDAANWEELVLPLENGPVTAGYLWLILPDTGAALAPAIKDINVR